ncbi:hypothetical protein [Ileibacterium valens]|uniref:hypothetical protein n=1 Tax=Ileibacterium valens TaxID=1862668 RepID=UPI00259BD973|nr:hypothetical protein [Ileibacterium valens]
MKFNMTEKTKKGLIIGGACTALLAGGFSIRYMSGNHNDTHFERRIERRMAARDDSFGGFEEDLDRDFLYGDDYDDFDHDDMDDFSDFFEDDRPSRNRGRRAFRNYDSQDDIDDFMSQFTDDEIQTFVDEFEEYKKDQNATGNNDKNSSSDKNNSTSDKDQSDADKTEKSSTTNKENV